MDFYKIATRETKNGTDVYPNFIVGRSNDLMVRGHAFHAVWDDERGLWSTDEYDVQRLVDADLAKYAERHAASGEELSIKYLSSFANKGWAQFQSYMRNVSDNSHQLDDRIVFSNTEVKKTDYVSRRLPYPLAEGDISAWDELVGTLYSVDERAKIEWAIGAIVSGDSKKIQKFMVLYGPPGTGKSTILDIIQKLFVGYYTAFDAKALGSNNNNFATEAFKSNPLVAIQHDGDLSKIEDNTKLNSIVSHEYMTMNEKFKPSYTARSNAFLFMGTNQPVKISDAKSGIIRRLIDVHPTGVRLTSKQYQTLMTQIEFELGAIAFHCLMVYREMGKGYYDTYRPLEMMLQTDIFFNFVEASYDVFKAQDGCTLQQAYSLYKEYCLNTGIERPQPMYKIREELRNYFDDFKDRHTMDDGTVVRSYYIGFNANRFKAPAKDDHGFKLVLGETSSLIDELLADCPAQYAKEHESGNMIPEKSWSSVRTKLSDLNTKEIHYVKPPENHIVIDFDLKDETGAKSLERNLAAASEWPPTYAELSQGGNGVHLHYTYTGAELERLAPNYSAGVEIKRFGGGASLRRRHTSSNGIGVAEISSGLPLKEEKLQSANTMQSERALRELIARNLRKEIHPGTKPSIDFIKKILDDAYMSEMAYDVTDLRPALVAFANNSTHQALLCLKIVKDMKFVGQGDFVHTEAERVDDRLVFYDVEVYSNLFVVCWKYKGSDQVVRMINPGVSEIEDLMKLRLVGFNNRRYDNHILYGRYLGLDLMGLYKLSQRLVDNERSATYAEAYGLSHADIYDFSSEKKSLKRFEIDLGLHHVEMDIPWDQPVPDDMVDKVVEYCVNDVMATEAVFESRIQDYNARLILAKLSGLSPNDTTQKHTAKIIFGDDKNPQSQFVYTHLDEIFPGYKFDLGKSVYLGEDVGEGGYVYAEPGMYENVPVIDVASMHPTSIVELNMFGPYTKNYKALMDARLAIKRKDYDAAGKALGGVLAPFLGSDEEAEKLSYALKIVINIVYGLTSAKFDNPFRDPRNKDNIAAKRGALFMITLKQEVQKLGYTVAHIKTDSIKIPGADQRVMDFVDEFGQKYGYTFEVETTYDRFCLVNDAVYIAYSATSKKPWTAVGAQFQHPYVFKTMFTKEPIVFNDLCETKQVMKGSMWLDLEASRKPMALSQGGMQFVGRCGRFTPVYDGGILWRVHEDRKYAVTGTKGFLWLESEVVQHLGKDAEIDMSYFESLVSDAIKTIDKFGDHKLLTSITSETE